MALADLLQQNAIIPALRVNSKKQLLQELAAKASKVTGLSEREIFDVILQRERLGSTGVGNGIAIPHGKLASVNSIVGIFARLDQPVDFEALGRPAGRSRVSAAGARRRRRRSFEGSVAHCPRPARSRSRGEAARNRFRFGDLCLPQRGAGVERRLINTRYEE
jgi:hypothetical protein